LEVEVPAPVEPVEPVPPEDVPPAEVPPDEVVPPVAAPVPVDPVAPVLPVEPVAPVEPVLPVEPVEPVEPVAGVLLGVVVLLGDVSDGEVEDASLLEDDDELLVEDPPSETFSGAISSEVCFGTVSCVTLLPPHALNPPVARSNSAAAVARRSRMRGGSLSSRTAPSAAPSGGRRSGSR
jgi:hypothetical protein